MAKWKAEHTFDPFELVDADKFLYSKEEREDILERVSDFVVEQILSDCSESRSTVTGRKFKELSKEYKKFKKSEGLPGKPDLTFDGEMLDALKAEVVRGGKIKVFVDGDEQAAKAHGHINGSEVLPERPFIPSDGDEFKSKDLKNGIRDILKDYPVND